jgi:hypothetical protein
MDDRHNRTRTTAQDRPQPDAAANDPVRIVLGLIGIAGALTVLAMNVAD